MNIAPVIKQINPKDPQLKEVIKASIGNPTDEKIDSVLLSYETQGELIGAFIGNQLVGCLGYELDSDRLIIKHLSVVDGFQNKKIGTGLIRHVLSFENCHSILACTDITAKGFYEKLQFQCRKSNSNFDTDRFECIYQKGSNNY